MNFLVCVTVLLTAIYADMPLVLFGGCPNVAGTPNFNLTRYLGQWFQISSLPVIFQDSSDGCVLANYTTLSNGLIGVHNSAVNAQGIRSGITGAAALIKDTTRGELNVAFFMPPSSTGPANYIVLDTDYTNFTYVWSCSDYVIFHIPALWIMNREYDHALGYIGSQEQAALDIIMSFGYTSYNAMLIRQSFIKTNTTSC